MAEGKPCTIEYAADRRGKQARRYFFSTSRTTVACLPSLVAVIVVLPCFLATTLPEADTVAMLDAELVHVTVRPVSIVPFALRSTAVAFAVEPTFNVADEREIAMLATAGGAVGGDCAGG